MLKFIQQQDKNENLFGNYEVTIDEEIYEQTPLEYMFDTFRRFLIVCGFSINNPYFLEESLTGEEYEFLKDQLDEFRKDKQHEQRT